VILKLEEVHTSFGLSKALSGVSLIVPDAKMVALIGPNGAGKSTTIFTICGLYRATTGKILLDSKEIMRLSPQEIKQLGLSTIPEGRRLFSKLTVIENLMIGAHLIQSKKQIKEALSSVFSLFPRLREREKQLAGSLSGGEQQMLAIGRGLMANPKMIMADEISIGLAPIIIQEIYRVLKAINEKGVSMLVVEQQARIAFKMTTYVYVIELGKIAMEGEPKDLIQNDYVINTYLGE
jgi:branched-chain amino acid transport system ATP-binding protein